MRNLMSLARFQKECLAAGPRMKCMVKQCKEKVIKSHSVSKSSVLSKLQSNGHVYFVSVKDDMYTFERIGINDASVFLGFCSKHDNDLFKCIDSEKYTDSPLQNACFFARSLANEYSAKIHYLIYFKKLLREMSSISVNKPFIANYIETLRQGIRDFNYHLKEIKLIQKGDYRNLWSKSYYLNYRCNAGVSSCVTPLFTFSGQLLQEAEEARWGLITLDIFPQDDTTVIIFNCLREYYLKFFPLFREIESFERNKELENRLNTFVAVNCKNFYVSLKLIQSANESDLQEFLELFSRELNESYSDSLQQTLRFNLLQKID